MSLPTPAAERTCVVTGASSGIGAELARQLAARGHGVTLVARREDRLRSLAQQLAHLHGVRAEVVAADLTQETERTAMVDTVRERGLTVDVLVNNAGLSTSGPLHRGDRQDELSMIRTDVEAVADLCALVLPGMVERRRGAILNVGSTAAFQPIPGQAGYGASKAFVVSFSHAIRAELKGTGVSVSVLCPGPVDTEFVERAGLGEAVGGRVPRAFFMDAEAVARAGIDGLAAGRPVIIPGLGNKLSAVGGHLTPRRVLMPLMTRFYPAMKATKDTNT